MKLARVALLLLLVAVQVTAQLPGWEPDGEHTSESALGCFDTADETDETDAVAAEWGDRFVVSHRDAAATRHAESPDDPLRACADRPPNA